MEAQRLVGATGSQAAHVVYALKLLPMCLWPGGVGGQLMVHCWGWQLAIWLRWKRCYAITMSQWWSQSLSTTCQAPEHHLEKLNLSLSAVPLPEPYQGKKAGYAPAVDTVWYLHWSGSSVSLEEIPSKWQYITITHSAPAGRSSTRTPESPKPRKAASVAGCLLTRCVLVSALAQCVPCLTTPSSDCSLSCP